MAITFQESLRTDLWNWNDIDTLEISFWKNPFHFFMATNWTFQKVLCVCKVYSLLGSLYIYILYIVSIVWKNEKAAEYP